MMMEAHPFGPIVQALVVQDQACWACQHLGVFPKLASKARQTLVQGLSDQQPPGGLLGRSNKTISPEVMLM